jgi:hypothetical protein
LINESRAAFVGHPDFGKDDFLTKLKGQMKNASKSAQCLMAELLWAILLFPTNVKATTKRHQVRDIWGLSGEQLPEDAPLLRDAVLFGIGSGGPGFNTYRPVELRFLIALTRDLKGRSGAERQHILTDYDAFLRWIGAVPQEGHRQFRHMLRFFAFPDLVERMSSNNDRRSILEAFGVAPRGELRKWTDRQLDEALLKLRTDLQAASPSAVIDFYAPELKEKWARSRRVRTPEGDVTVSVPRDDEEDDEENEAIVLTLRVPDARQSVRVQAKLAEIGATMGLNIWIPRSDRGRVGELVSEDTRKIFFDDLPLNYDRTTLETIEQIDVLWLKRRSIVRAFEVEHTTAVYSGLLRMADSLALQPNMDIRLHIVAPDERRDKVFREMLRPVFSLLDRGPLSDSCTIISYENVDAIRALPHLAYTSDNISKSMKSMRKHNREN